MILDVRSIRKEFDGHVAVDDVSFALDVGEILGLLGPNGAGKTTSIRMIVDILKPDRGEVRRGARSVGYLPEDRGLYQRLRVEEVLVFLGRLRDLDRDLARRRAEKYLDRVGLLDARRKRMRELSKGMQQKVQLVGAILHEPDLVILDEPFSGLDPVNREVVTEVILETAKRGAAVMLSSHVMAPVERMCRRVVLIHRGKVAVQGLLEEVRDRYADRRLVQVETDRPLDGHGDVEGADGGAVRLRDGVEPEDFLRRLIEAGHRVRRFECVRPTLDEVFRKVVSAS